MSSYFEDPHFLDLLSSLLIRDRRFLVEYGHLLQPDDFKPKPGTGESTDRWTVVTSALEHWRRFHEPIGKLLVSEMRQHCRAARYGVRREKQLLGFANQLLHSKLNNREVVALRLVEFRKQVQKATALQEILDLQGRGELTDERWLELCRQAVELQEKGTLRTTDILGGVKDRIERRNRKTDTRFPLLFIDPLDSQVKAIGRGHLGLILGPYKRGKSTALVWIARSYCLQHLNVLYITLEDPQEDVEDRFDAAITEVDLNELASKPKTVQKRFQRFRRLLRSHLHVYDGTDGGMTLADIEALYLRERDAGFDADAVIIDYDDEVVPGKKNKERRMELADIYRGMRQLAGKYQLIVWTAAQTQRKTEDLKIVGGDKVAEDVSKIRKSSITISLGKGEWGDDSLYLWVAAHKYDRQHVGCNIYTNRNRATIYDRERTLRKLKELAQKKPKRRV